MALCTLIFFNAEYLAKFVLKDSRTFLSIMVFTPAIFFISIGAVLKGYFYGLQYVKPPALIDILEKLIRLGGLVLTTYFLLPYGIEYVCGGVMTAMAAGELISLVLLYFCYRANRPAAAFAQTDSTIHIITKILKAALPLSLSGALTTIMDMITAVLIPMQLRAAGFSNSNALSLYGQVTGMVMPCFFPFMLFLPLVLHWYCYSCSYAAGNWTALNKKCNDSLKITSAIALLPQPSS